MKIYLDNPTKVGYNAKARSIKIDGTNEGRCRGEEMQELRFLD